MKYNATANVHKLFGVVVMDEEYIVTTSQAVLFVIPAILSVYDDMIAGNATTTICRKMEAARAKTINDRNIYDAANAGCRSFILDYVDDVWYRELCNLRTIYLQVTSKALLAHMRAVCTGLHEIDVITILPSILTMYENVESIPEYINVLEDARKRSACKSSDFRRLGYGHRKPIRTHLR